MARGSKKKARAQEQAFAVRNAAKELSEWDSRRKKRGATVGGDNPDDSGECKEPYSSEGRLRPEDPKPYAEGARASERGDRRPLGAPRRAGGALGGERPAKCRRLTFGRTKGSRRRLCMGKTQSRPYRNKIVIACALAIAGSLDALQKLFRQNYYSNLLQQT
ncbi:hypothetical protein GUJ93_ZPchr0013g36642 [Zizania palustris]|uniref:Uncharacterized protein n=1 Tax=Zizania palustris TaxID=103762 RepID=A0A8J6BUG3_ZIZPA|nr:hypothetical protein GUJ93_ZPchr0013g36642 [Zizania palustris]